jgi:ribosomal protein L11 methyltransferase
MDAADGQVAACEFFALARPRMTRSGVLWQVSVRLMRSDCDEAVGKLLAQSFGQLPSIHRDLEKGSTTVTIYLKRRPEWSRLARQRLTEALDGIQGIRASRGCEPKLSKLNSQNWAQSWKRHFKPLEIGKRLLIRPSWSRRRPRSDQEEVVLDPGMSFGTGQHPTTEFCLEELVRERRAGATQQPFLDVGTGSGILAISAAKLGCRPVHAFDIDGEAVRIARANARSNRVGTGIRFARKDLSALSASGRDVYAIICANLLANVLIAESRRLAGMLRPDGLLVVAGILNSEFHEVQQAYEGAGLRLIRSRRQREWRSGSFKK